MIIRNLVLKTVKFSFWNLWFRISNSERLSSETRFQALYGGGEWVISAEPIRISLMAREMNQLSNRESWPKPRTFESITAPRTRFWFEVKCTVWNEAKATIVMKWSFDPFYDIWNPSKRFGVQCFYRQLLQFSFILTECTNSIGRAGENRLSDLFLDIKLETSHLITSFCLTSCWWHHVGDIMLLTSC